MYCKECGTKNKEEAIFCEECGKKIKEKKTKQERKKVSKKNKLIIEIVVVIIIFLGLSFTALSYMMSPKKIAERYMEALVNQDINKLYSYLEIDGDKTFITKEIYQELLEKNKIINYKITDIEYGNNKLTTSVTFVYTEYDSKEEKTMRISLVKQKKKRLLFFDDWKISSSKNNDKIVENFKIIVPKNAKVTYAGVEVKENYLDKNNSTDRTDIYILKQVFRASTNITVELENGYKIEDEVTPNTYKCTYTASVSLSDITKEEQEKIKNFIQNDLTILYEGAIEDKDFASLEHINIEKNNSEAIEKKYNTLKENLKKAYNSLTAIEFTNITLSSVKLDEQGNLEFRLKANYQYSIQYLDSSSMEQVKTLTDYTYMNLSYSMKNKTYYIVDADNLEDHFSRY